MAFPITFDSSSAPAASVRGNPRICLISARSLSVFLLSRPPPRVERGVRLRKTPEMNPVPGSHGIGVHHRLQVADTGQFIDDDEQVLLEVAVVGKSHSVS